MSCGSVGVYVLALSRWVWFGWNGRELEVSPHVHAWMTGERVLRRLVPTNERLRV